MKLIGTFSVLLLAVFISITTASAQNGGATTDTVVYDVDGNKVEAGVNYYILSLIRGNGGGLSLSSRNESALCPLNVIQEDLEVSRGLPVKFYPVNPQDKVVTLSTDQNFEFDAMTVCVTSTVWNLRSLDDGTGRRYVGIGGEKGNPGSRTLSNWFNIQKEGSAYKLVFCPTVCDICRPVCGELGVFREDHKRWIGLNADKPLLVFFKRAD